MIRKPHAAQPPALSLSLSLALCAARCPVLDAHAGWMFDPRVDMHYMRWLMAKVYPAPAPAERDEPAGAVNLPQVTGRAIVGPVS